MSSITEALRNVFPGFHEARRERNRIRNRYRENLTALLRDDELYIISTPDYNPEYLQNWVKDRQAHTDHLIRENGSSSGGFSYIIAQNSEEVERALKKTIRAIRIQNWMSYVVEFILILFVLVALSLGIYLGLAGSGETIDLISNTTSL